MYKLFFLTVVASAVLFRLITQSVSSLNGEWVCQFEIYELNQFEGQYSITYFDSLEFEMILDAQFMLNDGHPIISKINLSGDWWIEGGRLLRQVTDATFAELTFRGLDVPEGLVPPTIFDELLAVPVYADILVLEEDALKMEETQSRENCIRPI